jgi:hypothetical protein
MTHRVKRRAVAACAAAALVATLLPASPAGSVATTAPGTSTECDPIDAEVCLLPFPNDRFTVPADTPTGLRVELPNEGMPANAGGQRIDPTEWNRNDGFSPGSMLLADVPGLDLQATFGLPAGVEVLDRPAVSLAPDAPIVLLDLDTGERVPYYAEVDAHPDAVAADRRLLIVRPLDTLLAGHRYGVALRSMRDESGTIIEPDPVFAWYRSERGRPVPGVEPARTADFQRLFRDLRKAGVPQDDLHLAWSFTVASDSGLAGRALHIRDEAFAAIGDTDLANQTVEGDAPTFTVASVQDFPTGASARRVFGNVLVPNFLHTDGTLTTDASGGVPLEGLLSGTQARFRYATPEPGPADLPIRNEAYPWLSVPYQCDIPRTATAVAPADPMLYGHGLLGTRSQAGGGSTTLLRERNIAPCGVDFAGMSQFDVPNAIAALQDVSRFGMMADRLQHGFLNFLFVGRALSHPQGFAGHPAFQEDGQSLIDVDTLSYTGISQGGILGGAVVALSPDLTNGLLDVPGINYSTLLNRSVDWEGAAMGFVYYGSYTHPVDRQLGFALMQMLWDRGEGNGYARRTTTDPLPNTPPHNVLLHVAFSDWQVANVATEVQARSLGARLLQTSLAAGRHWADDPLFRLTPFDVAPDGSIEPHTGSAMVYFDSGNHTPPSVNLPPRVPGTSDPHGDPRQDVLGNDQRAHFLRTGEVVDVYDGQPYWTQACRGPFNPNCP